MGFSLNVRELPHLELNVILQLSSSAQVPPCRTNHLHFHTFYPPTPTWVRSAGKWVSEENTVKQSQSAEEVSAELAPGMCPSTVAVTYWLSPRPVLTGWKRPRDIIAKNKIRWMRWPHLVPGGRLKMDTNMLILIDEHVLGFQEFCVWDCCLQSSGREARPST